VVKRTETQIHHALQDFIKSGKRLPSYFRILFIVGQNQMYMTANSANIVFSTNISESLTEHRERILEPFTRIEFLVDELIRIHLIGINSPKDKEINQILDGIGIARKFQYLYQWKIISNNHNKRLQNLIKVRNGVAHDVSLSNVLYKKKKIFQLGDKSNFNNFKTELENAWKELIEVYRKVQNSLDWDLFIDQILAQQKTNTTSKSIKSITKKRKMKK